MIPISLTLEGLYSYQERQTISFDTLIDAGLFGIFGKVGSGKSSLLEAISFALYGETERLNAKDNRAYNMMNLKSNRSIIDFEFYNFEEKKYRIFREFKRNSKRFEDVKRTEAIFYEWTDEKWKPLDHVNAEEIVGLSYENFKRTIIIPQGKFKEFIELGGTARTKMMQELFGLERYDLADKVRRLYLSNKENLDRLEGSLQAYEIITVEHIKESQRIWQEEFIKYEQQSKVFAVENKLLQQLKVVKETFEEFIKLQVKLNALEELEPGVLQEEEELAIYERVEKNFRQPLSEFNNIEELKAKFDKDKQLANDFCQQYEKKLQEAAILLQQWEPAYKNIEADKKQVFELGLIAIILRAREEIVKCLSRLEKGEPLVKQCQKEIDVVEKGLISKRNELKEIKLKRISTDILLEVGQWFLEKNRLETQLIQEREKCNATQEKIKGIAAERKIYELEEITWRESLNDKLNLLKEKEEQLLQQKNQLEVAQQLSHYTSALHNGVACPLCGSLEHPHIANHEDVSEELMKNQQELKNHKGLMEAHTKVEREMESISERIRLYEVQFKELIDTVKKIEVQLEEHNALFNWSGFNKEDELGYQNIRAAATLLEKEVEMLENSIEIEQENKGKLEKKKELFEKELDKIRKEELEWQSQIQAFQKQLDVLKWEDYKTQTAVAIEDSKALLEVNIQNIEKEYQKALAEKTDLQPKIASQKALLEKINIDSDLLQQQKESLQQKVNNLLEIEGFTRMNEVEVILNRTINTAEVRGRIQTFKIELGTVRNGVYSLKEKLATTNYDETVFKNQELKVKELELSIKQTGERSIQLKTTLDRLKEEFELKKELLQEQDRLQKRAANIQVMSNMFKASGFVNYVSAIYLKNLCDRANTRFHRLTKNQLSLQLNESNDFEILDYLNNGKTRSVKTLSGGQSFQVSLSLALALAESVQSLSKSNRNFFFIDEGFGTQDSESVDIVFETLQNLHKENRIVGIISHVEELQERIPISLTVIKDPEKGSVIQKSYEL